MTKLSFISIFVSPRAHNFKLCPNPYKRPLEVHATTGYKQESIGLGLLIERPNGVTASTKGPKAAIASCAKARGRPYGERRKLRSWVWGGDPEADAIFSICCQMLYILGSSLSENSKRQLPTKVAKPSRSLEEDYETFNVNRKQHSRANRPTFSKIKLIGFARILWSSQYIDGRGSYSPHGDANVPGHHSI